MEYILYSNEVKLIKSSLKAHINQCENFLNNGFLTEEEAEKLIVKVTRMKDLKNIFETK